MCEAEIDLQRHSIVESISQRYNVLYPILKTYPYPGNLGQLMPHKHSGELYFTDCFES